MSLFIAANSGSDRPSGIAHSHDHPFWRHLAADLVFSGHASLPDGGLKLFWPFSETSYAFPAVRWGDPLPTIILLAGAFAMLRWKSATQAIAALTILGLVGYIALRASWLPY